MSRWTGKNRRDKLPGRRFGDVATCPFHTGHDDDIKDLQSHKLDKWVFTLFVSSVTVLLVLAGSIFGYVAVEAINNAKHIAVIQVNQNRLLNHFDIPTVEDPETAKKILENNKENLNKGVLQ